MSRNAIVVAVGKKGTGKTTRVRSIARRCRRLIVADPENQWPVTKGQTLAVGADALIVAVRTLRAFDRRRPFTIVYRGDVGDLAEIQRAAPGVAYALCNVTLYFDELAYICGNRQVPPYLKRIIAWGRARRINVLGTTRDPQEIHGSIFSQADLVFLHRMQPGAGLNRVRELWGADVATAVQRLAPYDALTLGDSGVLGLFGREGLDK